MFDDMKIQKATLLRDQVLKTWSPPLKAGGESPAQIAQTAVMQTLAFVFGRGFMPSDLTKPQIAAIDQGIEFMNSVLNKSQVIDMSNQD